MWRIQEVLQRDYTRSDDFFPRTFVSLFFSIIMHMVRKSLKGYLEACFWLKIVRSGNFFPKHFNLIIMYVDSKQAKKDD